MVKIAVENDQHMIIEGCYLPYDWQKDFDAEYLRQIRFVCLVMTERYIREHFADIRRYGSVVENRRDDPDIDMDALLRDNAEVLRRCREQECAYILIEGKYRAKLPEC